MSKKYIVERPITVRSAKLILTDEQLNRRSALVSPAIDEDGNEIENVWSPKGDGVQFKVGEVVEFYEEAEKVLISNNQLREVSDEEAEKFLQERQEAREREARATNPAEFQRRPVGDRSSSPNARRAGLDPDVARRLGGLDQANTDDDEEEIEEEHEDPETKQKVTRKVKRKKARR